MRSLYHTLPGRRLLYFFCLHFDEFTATPAWRIDFNESEQVARMSLLPGLLFSGLFLRNIQKRYSELCLPPVGVSPLSDGQHADSAMPRSMLLYQRVLTSSFPHCLISMEAEPGSEAGPNNSNRETPAVSLDRVFLFVLNIEARRWGDFASDKSYSMTPSLPRRWCS
jgi:hypothetical protein